jgi:3-methyladenine DNA glycosylase AlkD
VGSATAGVRKVPSSRARPPRATAGAHAQAALALAGLIALGSQAYAARAMQFFKTGEGQYAAGDKFLGVRLPDLRKYARNYADAGYAIAQPLLKSGWHEARALALILLVRAYQRGDDNVRRAVYEIYMASMRFINNWDLVDLSAEHIVGAHLFAHPKERRRVLDRLARSSSLWERRIAVMATFHFIKQGEYAETFHVAQMLMDDPEDLIHKCVGWMLREVGKRVGVTPQKAFLARFYQRMPRTMLRYAIEHFSAAQRKRYLQGTA